MENSLTKEERIKIVRSELAGKLEEVGMTDCGKFAYLTFRGLTADGRMIHSVAIESVLYVAKVTHSGYWICKDGALQISVHGK